MIYNNDIKKNMKKDKIQIYKIKIFQEKKNVSVNPYLGFRKVVNFKSLFFSIIQMLHTELK
jgi:hypothetical protein